MRQVVQSGRGGRLLLKSVPAPRVPFRGVLIEIRSSLISAGTERQMVEFAQSSIFSKARARPDLVRKVSDKVHRDGPIAALRSVVARLDEPLPLGYSAAGEVIEVGAGLEGKFTVGQTVAIGGVGLANHAEVCAIPENLVVPVPSDIPTEQACFATLSSIALHAVRLLSPQIGECLAVLGAGLVGQLAAQFARIAGARVVVLDYDDERLRLAQANGAEMVLNLGYGEPKEVILDSTRGLGCDSILIAAATASSDPFHTAAAIARDRATVCLVGITGTEFPYRPFMQKEMRIVVSRSYGPGRYDRDFEQRQVKFPSGYIRWTETENLREAIRLMSPTAFPRLNVASLITHRFSLEQTAEAYDLILTRKEPHLGIVLAYPESELREKRNNALSLRATESQSGVDLTCAVGIIGAGTFGKTFILPALAKDRRVRLHTLVTSRGVSSQNTAQKFGFANASTNPSDVIDCPDIRAVVIATPHSSHAALVSRALAAQKNVFVEKPIAISYRELESIVNARNESPAFFMVGFNRRFAPYVVEVRQFLRQRSGRSMLVIRVNAGQLPTDSWQREEEEGGGRVVGELCHFVDLALDLVGSSVISVSAQAAEAPRGPCEDLTATIRFADGSLATIIYTTLGDTSFSKERIECYKNGAICMIDNFRRLSITQGGKRAISRSSLHQDKGHKQQFAAFIDGVIGGYCPIDEQAQLDSSVATLMVLDSLRVGRAIECGRDIADVAVSS